MEHTQKNQTLSGATNSPAKKKRAPCGSGTPVLRLPGWPRLLNIPLAAAYIGRKPGFLEARLRAGEIPYLIEDGQGRVVDRLDLDQWVDRQTKRTGKLRERSLPLWRDAKVREKFVEVQIACAA